MPAALNVMPDRSPDLGAGTRCLKPICPSGDSYVFIVPPGERHEQLPLRAVAPGEIKPWILTDGGSEW